MFHLWTRGGGEFGTRDTAQGFPFLCPDAVSSLSNLVYTLIGDMHDTIDVSMQQVARTDAHSGDRHFTPTSTQAGLPWETTSPAQKYWKPPSARTSLTSRNQPSVRIPTAPSRFIVVDIISPAWHECRRSGPTSCMTTIAGLGALVSSSYNLWKPIPWRPSVVLSTVQVTA